MVAAAATLPLVVCTELHETHSVSQLHACRVADYWEGYKLFCYAYYSHSIEHETEFRQSKLGSWTETNPWFNLCTSSLLVFPSHGFMFRF